MKRTNYDGETSLHVAIGAIAIRNHVLSVAGNNLKWRDFELSISFATWSGQDQLRRRDSARCRSFFERSGGDEAAAEYVMYQNHVQILFI